MPVFSAKKKKKEQIKQNQLSCQIKTYIINTEFTINLT